MKIDKAKRDAARHKKTEAVDSYVATQKDDPVHSHSDGIKTVSRSGVVARNDKNVGHEAMKRAREAIERVESVTFQDNRAKTGTNDDWFEMNKVSVEQQIKERINVKNSRVQQVEIQPTPTCKSNIVESIDFENYRPVVDDDATDYIPLNRR